MRIALVRPSHKTGSLFLKKLGFLPVPIGLLQLAGELLRSDSNSVSVIDMEADEMTVEEVAFKLKDLGPDLVGITLHATAATNTAVDIIRKTRELLPGVRFIAGGHHATFMSEELIEDGFDFVALGEGDETIAELVEALQNGREVSAVRGLVYSDKGRATRTSKRELIKNLDKLSIPAFHLVDRSKYKLETFGEDDSVICLETSRGCPYACDFCSVTPVWGNKWRSKSNDRIMEELETASRLGYRWVFFTDDVFFAEAVIKERTKLFDTMISRGLDINWIAQTRPDAVVRHPDIIEKAARAGMRMAAIGVESGSSRTLRMMKKGLRPSVSYKAVEILDGKGVLTLCSIMLGAPHESIGDMVETIRFGSKLVNAGADLIQFTVYTPFPGTPVFYDAVRKERLMTTNWERFDILTPVMRTKVSPAVIQLLQSFGVYYFQFKSFLRFKLKRQKMDREKAALLEEAISYVLGKMPVYLKDMLGLPRRMKETMKLFEHKGRESAANEQRLVASENSLIYSTTK